MGVSGHLELPTIFVWVFCRRVTLAMGTGALNNDTLGGFFFKIWPDRRAAPSSTRRAVTRETTLCFGAGPVPPVLKVYPAGRNGENSRERVSPIPEAPVRADGGGAWCAVPAACHGGLRPVVAVGAAAQRVVEPDAWRSAGRPAWAESPPSMTAFNGKRGPRD